MISATQIKAFRSCPRKWGLSYLQRVPRVESGALQFGSALHASIAEYMVDRGHWSVEPSSTLGQLTQDMARCIALDGQFEIEIESPSKYERWIVDETGERKRLDWTTRIGGQDFLVRPDVAILLDGVLRIVDWKTTAATQARSSWVLSSRRLWPGKRPPECRLLVEDEQAQIYSHGGFTRFSIGAVVLQWVYGSKTKRGAHHPTWSVIETVGVEQNAHWCDEQLASPAAWMHILRSAHARGELDPQRLPHDGSACDYHGKFCDGLAWCGFREAHGGPSLEDFRRRLPVVKEQ